MKTALAGIAAVTLAGCATAPFSYLDGNRYFRTPLNTYSVIVLDVDGRADVRNPFITEPGLKVVRVQAPPGSGFRIGEARSFTLDVKPCTRYYLKAVKTSPLQQDFEPAVDFEEPIAGCTA